MTKPYRIDETDSGLWRVLLYAKPIGYGVLTFKQEIEAEILCAALNDAYETGLSMGYDNGQNDAARRQMISN